MLGMDLQCTQGKKGKRENEQGSVHLADSGAQIDRTSTAQDSSAQQTTADHSSTPQAEPRADRLYPAEPSLGPGFGDLYRLANGQSWPPAALVQRSRGRNGGQFAVRL